MHGAAEVGRTWCGTGGNVWVCCPHSQVVDWDKWLSESGKGAEKWREKNVDSKLWLLPKSWLRLAPWGRAHAEEKVKCNNQSFLGIGIRNYCLTSDINTSLFLFNHYWRKISHKIRFTENQWPRQSQDVKQVIGWEIAFSLQPFFPLGEISFP